jgi:hypothetical protein
VTMDFAVALGRNDDFGPRLGDLFVQMVGVIALVGDRGANLEAIDKIVSKGDVVALPGAGDQTNG